MLVHPTTPVLIGTPTGDPRGFTDTVPIIFGFRKCCGMRMTEGCLWLQAPYPYTFPHVVGNATRVEHVPRRGETVRRKGTVPSRGSSRRFLRTLVAQRRSRSG